MKRSEINSIIREAETFFASNKFILPPYAAFSPPDWKRNKQQYREILDLGLGWDITDFGSGEFLREGLLLFTLRNGSLSDARYPKPYAEKIMIVREHQITPMHYHYRKMEDIINRGGGDLVIELAQEPVHVSVDGIMRALPPGSRVRLRPGQSITLTPHLYHAFWAEGGAMLAGEISTVNDDSADNCFFEPKGRFPEIDEDETPYRLLVGDYGKLP
jgi:D-lyxose ketol-isomerase